MVVLLLFGFSGTAISQAKTSLPSPVPLTLTTYTGNVTIEPNGTVHGSNPGSIPIAQSGDIYTFQGQINGSLTILRSGATVNGENFSLVPVYGSVFSAITLVNASNVKITNFNLSSGGPNFGVFLNNTSNDLLNRIVVAGYQTGFQILNYTHNINISNSKSYDSFASLASGSLVSGNTGPLSLTSSNITVYNFTSDFTFGGILIATQYSNVIDSSVSYFYAGGIFTAANNTLFSGNRINATDSDSAFSAVSSIAGIGYHNVSFRDNTVWSNASSISSTTLIDYSNVSGNLSGNTININASGKQVTAISLLNGEDTVASNSINITNAGQTSSFYTTGITLSGGSYMVKNNRISISGQNASGIGAANSLASSGGNTTGSTVSGNVLDMHVGGGFGVLMNTTNSVLSNNSVYMNTTYGSITGIGVNGFNDGVFGNKITMSFQKVNPLSATGIGNITGLPGYFGNLSINDNTISFGFPQVTLFHFSNFVGISYQSNSARNILISGNTITEPTYYGFVGNNAIFIIINSGIQISNNVINALGGILALGNDSVISFNDITFSNPGIGFGGFNSPVNNALILDNNLNCLFDGTFGIVGDYQNNVTIDGNYFYGNTIDLAFTGGVSNATVYHNDFFNSSAVPIEIANYIGHPNLNISLNASYPVGGNYYAGLAGNDNYSGPLQNIKGGDGIFDTNYTVNYDPGYADMYPLAKPWLRPQFTILETGLLNGAVWSATFNGQTKTSDGTSITFNIMNATYQTYSYSYVGVNGYVGSGSGTYQYNGANNSAYTARYIPIYQLNFTESGLPVGSTWQIIVNGSLHNVSGKYINIAVDNGTLISYSVHNGTAYYTSNGNGYLKVSGNATLNFIFYHYAYLVGNVLPSSSAITVNGKIITVSNGHFNVTLVGGSYEIVVTDGGYTSSYRNITLQPGQTYSLNISLNRTGSSGLTTTYEEYFGIGAVAVVALGFGTYTFRRKK